MEGLTSLLLFAVLFFVMMRFGCGAHMTHGHGGHEHGHGKDAGGAGDTDPVCGMKVAPDSGYSKAHAGTRHVFCSKACLDKFDADPERYLKAAATEGGSS
jgi:YHS domain-containing protein